MPDDLAESHPVVATHREMMNLGVLSHEMVDVPKSSVHRETHVTAASSIFLRLCCT